jgi:peptidoglycan/LPS O-acetylase OafA/YrhL
MSEPRHFAFLDTVRGAAFLLVILLHTALAVGPFPSRSLLQEGGYGVQLFFLASAITLCHSMNQRKLDDAYPVGFFYLRRLFRIAPLFWLALIFYWVVPNIMPAFWLGQWAPLGVHPSYFVLTALFLHGWHPHTFNSIVPGGWSIAVEMTFYVVFPLLFCYVNSLKRAMVAVLASFVYLKIMLHRGWPTDSFFPFVHDHIYAGIGDHELDFFINLWFPAQLPVFLVGFLAYYLLQDPFIQKAMENKFWPRILFLVGGIALLEWSSIGSGFVPGIFPVVLTMAGLIVAVSGASMRWLVNPVICGLGRISFSCYLMHFAGLGLALKWLGHGQVLTEAAPAINAGGPLANSLLFLRLLAVALLLTVVFSTLTYHLVEKPGIEIGRRLIRKLNQRAREAAAAGAAVPAGSSRN